MKKLEPVKVVVNDRWINIELSDGSHKGICIMGPENSPEMDRYKEIIVTALQTAISNTKTHSS